MKWVLFYDGECAFCSQSVNRVFDLDRKGVIDFAPLQGELARARDLGKHADPQEGTMVFLREADGAMFFRSDALIELARVLGGPFHVLAMLARVVPRPIRDGAYKWFARNRHRFGGGADACRLPTPEFLARVRA
jgi:predicted DCC family thiol-disulfide oxidoreductase YuxK